MNNDMWAILLLIFTVLDGDRFINLLKSENFDKEYEEMMNEVVNMEPGELKKRVIEVLSNGEDTARNMNTVCREKMEGATE